MQFFAKARYVRFSPYKLRSLVDVIRGKNVLKALHWLSVCKMQRVDPIKKVVESAASNARNLKNITIESLFIKEIRVDEGPTRKYFKPGAMGRSCIYRKRSCHLTVVVESIENKVN